MTAEDQGAALELVQLVAARARGMERRERRVGNCEDFMVVVVDVVLGGWLLEGFEDACD